MNQNNGLLTICSGCRSIKIAPRTWLSRGDHPIYYDRLDALYRDDERSHGFCPTCYKELERQIPKKQFK